MSNVGRKKAIYDENVILKLINDCKTKNDIFGKVKYKDVHDFSVEQYENGQIDFKLSEDYWRKPNRQGTELLKKYNESFVDKRMKEDNAIESEYVLNLISDDIDKKSLKKIEQMIRMNESVANKNIERNNKLSKRLEEKDKEITDLKEELKKTSDIVKMYEQLLFELADNSNNKEIAIDNIITTGKTRGQIVQRELEGLFSKEIATFKKSKKTETKVIALSAKTASDDFGEF